MTPDGPGFRLSDDEREDAIEALGEHLRTGRLTIDEYGDRTAQVTAAKTRGELVPLFSDLPDPRPATLQGQLPEPRRTEAPAQRGAWLAAGVVPVATVVAVVLFLLALRGFWPLLVLSAAAALVAGTAFRYRPDRG